MLLVGLDGALVEEVEGALAAVAGELNAAHGRLVAVVARALETRVWVQAGIHSPAHWLAWKTGLSPARAREIVLLAQRQGELPVTVGALASGELAVDQAVAVVRRAPAWADGQACEIARHATVVQARKVMNGTFPPLAPPRDPVEGAPPEPAPPPETCTFGVGDDGRFFLHADADPDHGAIVESALAEAHDALVQAGQREVSWVDALVETARRSLAAAEPARRDRFRSYVHLDGDSLSGPQARFAGGAPLPEALRRLLTCDGEVQAVRWRAGVPVNLGRVTRTVPPHLRRLLLKRDGHLCRTPGCGSTQWLQVHHVEHWEDDGPTDTWNLAVLCRGCHRRHHLGQLGITGNADQPDGLVFTDQWGRVLSAAAQPRPPTGPPVPPDTPYRHPTGERLQTKWVTFAEPVVRVGGRP
jgi:hypothetical protein